MQAEKYLNQKLPASSSFVIWNNPFLLESVGDKQAGYDAEALYRAYAPLTTSRP